MTISVTCSDGVTLGQGSTQYKCRECGGSLNAHSKECAMRTSVSENNLDLSELDEKEREANSKIALLEAQISQLETENRNLLTQIANASVEEAPALRQQHNVNKTKIDNLKKELATWQQQLADIQNAKSEAANDNATSTDDYYRIPAIMQDVKSAYNLTWQGAGSWNGYTYVRTATMPNINGIITFKATLSIARKPKYFLGIKIHRAILQISWELTSEYTDTQVVDVLTLDPNASDEEKTRQVNSRISEIAQEFPSCSITTEYAKSEATQTADNDDVIHLLWSSDRLEIAREVDSRITKIYADLVSLEKMMHYKRSIIDVLKDILPSSTQTKVAEGHSLKSATSDGERMQTLTEGMVKITRTKTEGGTENETYHHHSSPADYPLPQYSLGAMGIRCGIGGSIHQRPQEAAQPLAGTQHFGVQQSTAA